MATVGIIHTGAMGTTIADALLRAGHDVLSATKSRSELTQERARLVGTREVETLDRVFEEADVVFSVSQFGGVIIGESAVWDEEKQTMVTEEGIYPRAIEFPTMDAAIEADFLGIYVDCNWVHPSNWEDFRETATLLNSYVEGAIYGYPMSHEMGHLRRFIWLSGDDALSVSDLFFNDPLSSLVPIVLPPGVQAREFKEESAKNDQMPEGWGETICR
jgi:hypothetical protein